MAKKLKKTTPAGNRPSAHAVRGRRFRAGPAKAMEEINASIDFDRRLYAQDIAASKAHAAMLAKTGIISKADGKAIVKGLDAIAREIKGGNFSFKRALEDIHMNVETRLGELIGAAAGTPGRGGGRGQASRRWTKGDGRASPAAPLASA